MFVCPHCGFSLKEPIISGIGSCGNCHSVFDTSPYNRLLSICWYVRKNHIEDFHVLKRQNIKPEEALIAVALAYEGNYSHSEVVEILNNLGISKNLD